MGCTVLQLGAHKRVQVGCDGRPECQCVRRKSTGTFQSRPSYFVLDLTSAPRCSYDVVLQVWGAC